MLKPTRDKVRKGAEKHADKPENVQDRYLRRASGLPFYNTSELTLGSLPWERS